MQLTTEFKNKVRDAVLEARKNYGGSDADYSKKLGISSSIYSRLKSGETDKIISDTQWLTMGRELNVSLKKNNWKIARTSVYAEIESNLTFCQSHSKSMMLVDDCGIGKTFCAIQAQDKEHNYWTLELLENLIPSVNELQKLNT